jgi:hypothetical protein
MENYRKLTEQELSKFGIKTFVNDSSSKLHNSYREFVKRYYPANADLIEVIVHSEYNDNTYDNGVQMVVVYDSNGDEITPNKKTASECRQNMASIGIGNNYSTNEPIESFFIHMTPKVPQLYVKI